MFGSLFFGIASGACLGAGTILGAVAQKKGREEAAQDAQVVGSIMAESFSTNVENRLGDLSEIGGSDSSEL